MGRGNIGNYAAETFDVSQTFVVSATDQTLFAFRDGVASGDDALTFFGSPLTRHIGAARKTPMVEPEPVSAFYAREDGVYLVAVSAITPENPTAGQLRYEPRPVLLHAKRISGDLLNLLASRFGFVGLELSITEPTVTRERLPLALRGLDGVSVGCLVWTPPHPGSALFAEVLPWTALEFLLLGILGFVFVRRVMWTAHKLEEDARALAEKDHQLAQTSKLAVLGEMAAGVVHELNQPLNIIRMAADSTQTLLRQHGDATDTGRLSEQLTVIGEQTRRMAETIQSMRILSRDDYGRKSAFDPVRATNQVLSWLRPELAERAIVVTFQAPAECGRIFGEPARFEQVIVNLILSARDAIQRPRDGQPSREGEIRVEIFDDKPRDLVRVVVHDNGGGIAEENLGRLFDPFFTTKAPGDGTGLGLSISYGIVLGMDGELDVANHPEGATFSIELPRVVPKDKSV